MVIALKAHTDAVLEAVRTAVDPVLVGLAKTPKGAGYRPDGSFVKYVSLFPRPEGGFSGTLGAFHTDSQRVYQASCIGEGVEQSEDLADDVLGILDGFTIPGRHVNHIEIEGMPGSFRDPDTEPPVFVTPVLFRIVSTSS